MDKEQRRQGWKWRKGDQQHGGGRGWSSKGWGGKGMAMGMWPNWSYAHPPPSLCPPPPLFSPFPPAELCPAGSFWVGHLTEVRGLSVSLVGGIYMPCLVQEGLLALIFPQLNSWSIFSMQFHPCLMQEGLLASILAIFQYWSVFQVQFHPCNMQEGLWASIPAQFGWFWVGSSTMSAVLHCSMRHLSVWQCFVSKGAQLCSLVLLTHR